MSKNTSSYSVKELSADEVEKIMQGVPVDAVCLGFSQDFIDIAREQEELGLEERFRFYHISIEAPGRTCTFKIPGHEIVDITLLGEVVAVARNPNEPSDFKLYSIGRCQFLREFEQVAPGSRNFFFSFLIIIDKRARQIKDSSLQELQFAEEEVLMC